MIKFISGIIDLLGSDTLWAAIGSVGTVVALYFLYRQIRDAANISAYDFLRKEDDRFRSDKLVRRRSDLAKVLLQTPEDFDRIDAYADYVLDFFEDLGLILRRRLAPAFLVWSTSAYYVLRYWAVVLPYIRWVRDTYEDPSYYTEFEYLHRVMMKLERRESGKKRIEFSQEELTDFLQDEIDLEIRRCNPANLDSVMEVEKCSFRKSEAYSEDHFKQLLSEHPGGFLVAELSGEIVGYSIAYMTGTRAEIDSIAVDWDYWNLGIGTKLMYPHINRFRKRGIATCSLEVRTTNDVAMQFYQKLGFEIEEELESYYDDGANAYLMVLRL